MRACWLKWVGRDWSISADYIWLNYSDANMAAANAIVSSESNRARGVSAGADTPRAQLNFSI